MPDEACRIDVWLWRARFFKTRALAARVVDEGKIRRGRNGAVGRIDKVSRPVKVGDDLVFAVGGRLVCVTVAALGERRGPPAEARGLYKMTDEGPDGSASPATPPLTSRPRD